MEGEAKKKGMPMASLQSNGSFSSAAATKSRSVKPECKRGKKRSTSVADMSNMQLQDVADSSIAKFFFANGIPFHVACSPYFKQMLKDALAVGSSYVPPGEHKLRTSLLDKEYSKASIMMKGMRQIWIRNGCSIIMDVWTDNRHRPLINVIVSCSTRSYFLKVIDCSGKRKDANFQFQILKDAIEEVGPSNVVQVVTNSTCVCKSVGLMVEDAYKHIFWTPCYVHALNNALKDIGKIDWVKEVVLEARNLQMFICNHHTSLALFKTFSSKEFLKLVDTRYASYFTLLERMIEVQEALQLMVVNSEWLRCVEANTTEGISFKQKILSNDWWSTMRYIFSIISPILQVIRYADADSSCLGEIYETFDSMLGQIKQAIHSRDPNLRFYEEHIKLIVSRRLDTIITPLHMTAYALNPKWYAGRFVRGPPSNDEKVKEGLMKALGKMYTKEDSSKLRAQWLAFVNLSGRTFNTPEAWMDRGRLAQENPIGWWIWHGIDTPELSMLATRLFSQVASSFVAKRYRSTYNFIQSMKRNRLTPRQSEKLVAVHNVLRLQDQQTPAACWDVDPEDATHIDDKEAHDVLLGFPFDQDETTTHSCSDSDSDCDAVLGDAD